MSEALKSASGALRLHIATGLYTGPFLFPAGTELVGPESAVLFAEAPATVVQGEGALTLRGLTVEGGAKGLLVTRDVTLEGVHFSGQREVAVEVRAGLLRAKDVSFSAAVSGVRALVLEAEGSARLYKSRFVGPFKEGVEARFPQPRTDESLELDGVEMDGPVRGLRLVNAGKVAVRRTRIARGRGDGVLVARTALELEGVSVEGHEYGFSFGEGTRVNGRGLTSTGADFAGVAVVHATAVLRDVNVTDAGAFGGLQVIASKLWLERFRLAHSKGYGLAARSSLVAMHDGTIVDTVDPDGDTGDGVQMRGSTGQLSGVYIARSANLSILSAEQSDVSLVNVSLVDSTNAGVAVETRASVEGVSVHIEGGRGPGAVVMKGELRADAWTIRDNGQPALWPECELGARVSVYRLEGTLPARGRPGCILAGKSLAPRMWTVEELMALPGGDVDVQPR